MTTKEIKFNELESLLLKFLGIGDNYHGTLNLKIFNGKIANIHIDDSVDMTTLRGTSIIKVSNEMFIKHGSPNQTDKDSSKLISEVIIDKDNKITKESKLKPEEKDKEDDKETEKL